MCPVLFGHSKTFYLILFNIIMSNMLKLQGSWSVNVVTHDQAKRQKNAIAGRKLWLDVLKQHREKRASYVSETEDCDMESETDSDFESDEDLVTMSDEDTNAESDRESELVFDSDDHEQSEELDHLPDGAEDESNDAGVSMEVDTADVPSDAAAETLRSDTPFRFLHLAPELRNMISVFYLADYKHMRSQHHRRAVRLGRNRIRQPSPSPPPEFKRRREVLRKERRAFRKLFANHLASAEADATICPGAIQVFRQYMSEHTLKSSRRRNCQNQDEYGECQNLMIHIRGHMCSDLTMLCLVNQQILAEAFELVYPKIPRNPMEAQVPIDEDIGEAERDEKDEEPARSKIVATIANFNVFPFLRICHMLGKYTSISERDIEIEWKAHDRSEHIQLERIMGRFIELHWLQGIPIWSCFTNSPPFGTATKAGPMPD